MDDLQWHSIWAHYALCLVPYIYICISISLIYILVHTSILLGLGSKFIAQDHLCDERGTELRPGLKSLSLTWRIFAKTKQHQRQLKLWEVRRDCRQDMVSGCHANVCHRAMYTHLRGRQNLWSVLWRVKLWGGFILTNWPTLAKGGISMYTNRHSVSVRLRAMLNMEDAVYAEYHSTCCSGVILLWFPCPQRTTVSAETVTSYSSLQSNARTFSIYLY